MEFALSKTQLAVITRWVLGGSDAIYAKPAVSFTRRTIDVLQEQGLLDRSGPTRAAKAYVNREEIHAIALLGHATANDAADVWAKYYKSD